MNGLAWLPAERGHPTIGGAHPLSRRLPLTPGDTVCGEGRALSDR